tara:strand:+ start:365 stop:1201 length:837 start_codon:yes stop_codon:yes gene_type:complete
LTNKLILFGSSGHLGSHLKQKIIEDGSFDLYCPDKEDIQNILNGGKSFHKFKNAFFINLVAIVGNQKIKQNKLSYIELINSTFPFYLAKICLETNSKLIHISSNSVFDDSNERYRNINTKLKSKSLYGISKIKAELNIQKILPDNNYLILRTPQQYSMKLIHKRNLFNGVYEQLKTQKKIIISKNEIFTIASCDQISNFILMAINKNLSGIYHLCEPLEYSWLDIAIFLCNIMKYDLKKSIILDKNFKTFKKNSTICPSSEGLLYSDLNNFFKQLNGK